MAEISASYIPAGKQQDFLLKLFQVSVPAGKRDWREHRHLQFEMVLFLEGTGRYTTLKKEYPIRPGDVFIFASNEVHCITAVDAGGMRLMNVHFEPRYLWSDGKALSPKNAALCFTHSDTFENRLPEENAATGTIRRLLRETEQELRELPEEYELMVRLRITEIFLLLIRELGYGRGVPEVLSRQRHLQAVSDAMEYVNSHLPEQLTLQEIADAVRMSPNYFSALFRRVNQMTLWDYVTARRVELAARLLDADSCDSMLEVAMRAGFNNTANFNKSFKKYAGMTPTEYLRHEVPFPY